MLHNPAGRTGVPRRALRRSRGTSPKRKNVSRSPGVLRFCVFCRHFPSGLLERRETSMDLIQLTCPAMAITEIWPASSALAGRQAGNGDVSTENRLAWRPSARCGYLGCTHATLALWAHYNSARFHPFRFENLSMPGQARSSCLSPLESSTRGGDFVKHLRFLACCSSCHPCAVARPAARGLPRPAGPRKKFVVATDATLPAHGIGRPEQEHGRIRRGPDHGDRQRSGLSRSSIKNTAWDGIFAGLEGGLV